MFTIAIIAGAIAAAVVVVLAANFGGQVPPLGQPQAARRDRPWRIAGIIVVVAAFVVVVWAVIA